MELIKQYFKALKAFNERRKLIFGFPKEIEERVKLEPLNKIKESSEEEKKIHFEEWQVYKSQSIKAVEAGDKTKSIIRKTEQLLSDANPMIFHFQIKKLNELILQIKREEEIVKDYIYEVDDLYYQAADMK